MQTTREAVQVIDGAVQITTKTISDNYCIRAVATIKGEQVVNGRLFASDRGQTFIGAPDPDPDRIELDEVSTYAAEQTLEIAKQAWEAYQAGNLGTVH